MSYYLQSCAKCDPELVAKDPVAAKILLSTSTTATTGDEAQEAEEDVHATAIAQGTAVMRCDDDDDNNNKGNNEGNDNEVSSPSASQSQVKKGGGAGGPQDPRELQAIISQTRAHLEGPAARSTRLNQHREDAIRRKEVAQIQKERARLAEIERRNAKVIREHQKEKRRKNPTEDDGWDVEIESEEALSAVTPNDPTRPTRPPTPNRANPTPSGRATADTAWTLQNTHKEPERKRRVEALETTVKSSLLPSKSSLIESELVAKKAQTEESFVATLPVPLKQSAPADDIFRRWRIEETRLQLEAVRREELEEESEAQLLSDVVSTSPIKKRNSSSSNIMQDTSSSIVLTGSKNKKKDSSSTSAILPAPRSIFALYNDLAIRSANEDIIEDVDKLKLPPPEEEEKVHADADPSSHKTPPRQTKKSVIPVPSLDTVPNALSKSALQLAQEGSGSKYVESIRERIQKASSSVAMAVGLLRKEEENERNERGHRSAFTDVERRRMLAALQKQRKANERAKIHGPASRREEADATRRQELYGDYDDPTPPAATRQVGTLLNQSTAVGNANDTMLSQTAPPREDDVVQRMLHGNLVRQNFVEHPIDAYQRKVREDMDADRAMDDEIMREAEEKQRRALEEQPGDEVSAVLPSHQQQHQAHQHHLHNASSSFLQLATL